MKGWHWLCNHFLSLTPVTLAQLFTMLIPFYLFFFSLPAYSHLSLHFWLSLLLCSLSSIHPSLSHVPCRPFLFTPAFSLHINPCSVLIMLSITHSCTCLLRAHLCCWIKMNAHNVSPSWTSTQGCFDLSHFSSHLYVTCIQLVHWYARPCYTLS